MKRRLPADLTDLLLMLAGLLTAAIVLAGAYVAYVAFTAAAALLRLAEILTHNGG